MVTASYLATRPLRVAFFQSYRAIVDGEMSGGGTYETALLGILEELKSAGEIELVHFLPRSSGDRRPLPREHQGSPVVGYRPTLIERWVGDRPDSLFTRSALTRGWLTTKNLLEKQGIDLVYFSSLNHTALRLDTIPFIFTVWDTGHRDLPGFPETSSHREWVTRENLYSMAVPRAVHVMTDSVTTGKRLEDLYGLVPERWSSIGLLPHVPTLAPSAPLVDGDYIIYPAARWPHKNHATLFRAMVGVRKIHPELRLVLTGDDHGHGEALKHDIARLGLQGVVRDLGLVSREDLYVLIRDAKALVMPSLFGPTNLPPLEALGLGTPAIVSDIHRFEPEISSRLIAVPTTDSSAWAKAIISSLRKKKPAPVSYSFDTAREEIRRVFAHFAAERQI